ncbi:hypothetical protein CRE_08527 [Caenorhabditis remanei]|uniref:Uncharacterized protein n=1 Tax=Caenorhabditis remanei TaxID=31234 RepID=E3N6Y3_CAERE|nr:hypothetical protein CRE_08527 [Caenorhabditis remanei]
MSAFMLTALPSAPLRETIRQIILNFTNVINLELLNLCGTEASQDHELATTEWRPLQFGTNTVMNTLKFTFIMPIGSMQNIR